MIVTVPFVSLSSSWLPARVIGCALPKTVGSKVIVSASSSTLARLTASRRLSPLEPVLSFVVFTTSTGSD